MILLINESKKSQEVILHPGQTQNTQEPWELILTVSEPTHGMVTKNFLQRLQML